MEGHRRNPEREAGKHEDDRDQSQLGIGESRQRPGAGGNRLEVAQPAHAVKIGKAKEQEPRREDAQEEVLRRRFLGGERPTAEVKQQVRRHAHQLEPHEQEHQLVGGDDQHCPGVHDQERAEELAGPLVARLFVGQGHEHQPAQDRTIGCRRTTGIVQGHRGEVFVWTPETINKSRNEAARAPVAIRNQIRRGHLRNGASGHHRQGRRQQNELRDQDPERLLDRLVCAI